MSAEALPVPQWAASAFRVTHLNCCCPAFLSPHRLPEASYYSVLLSPDHPHSGFRLLDFHSAGLSVSAANAAPPLWSD